MKPSVTLSMIVGLVAMPAMASAQDQPWLKDRRYAEGIGYRVGDFELHPGAAAEFGYDSNFFRRADSENPLGTLRLRITPSFSFSTLSAQRREAAPGTTPPDVEFHGGLSVTYNEFFPVNGGAANASGDEFANARAQRNVNGNLDLGLLIAPGRAWSGSLTAGFVRTVTAADQVSAQSYNRDIPRAGAELIWTPGAGLFEWRLGYQFTGTFFEASNYAHLNSLTNQVQTRGRWRFLPRTALVFDGKFGFLSFPNGTGAIESTKTGGHPVRALLGLNGLVTQSFSLLAMAGWGASFYTTAPQEDFDSVIGQVELKWFLSPATSNDPAAAATGALSSVSIGFVRDFVDSYIRNYYERDRGYVSFTHLFAGKFLAVAEGGVGPMIYPKSLLGTGTGEGASFTDIRADASVFGEYRFGDAFGVNATVRYNQNVNNNPLTQTGPGVGGPNDLSFRQFEAYVGVRWLM